MGDWTRVNAVGLAEFRRSAFILDQLRGQDGTRPAGAPRSWPTLSALPLAPGKAVRALAVTAWCWKPNTMSFKALLDHYGRDSAPVEVRRRDWLGIVPSAMPLVR